MFVMHLPYYIATLAFSILGVSILHETRRVYSKGETLSLRLSIKWWILDCEWTIIVILSSLHRLWPLPFEKTTVLVCGLALLAIGVATISAGVMEFCSLRKISGMEVSKLITTGIYRWSRNPQFLGLYLSLLGIALLGHSGYALLLTIVAII